MKISPQPLVFELRDPRFVTSKSPALFPAWMIAYAVLALAVIAPVAILWPLSPLPLSQTIEALWKKFATDPAAVLLDPKLAEGALMLLLALFYPLLIRAAERRKQKLVLEADRIRVASRFPRVGRFFGQDWELALGDIERATVVAKSQGPNSWAGVELHLIAGHTRRVVRPALWFLPGEGPRKRHRTRFLALRHAAVPLDEVDALPLIRALRERGVDVRLSDNAARERGPDDLFLYPSVAAVTVASIALGLYSFVDAFMLEYHLVGPSIAQLIEFGAVCAALALLLFSRSSGSEIPIAMRLGVAALFGTIVAVAALPATLRIGTLVGELHPVTFEADGVGGLKATDPSSRIPDWKPTHATEFFTSLKQGQRVELNVRKGILGFWQYDLTRIDGDLDRFYGERSRAAERASK